MARSILRFLIAPLLPLVRFPEGNQPHDIASQRKGDVHDPVATLGKHIVPQFSIILAVIPPDFLVFIVESRQCRREIETPIMQIDFTLLGVPLKFYKDAMEYVRTIVNMICKSFPCPQSANCS